MVASRRVQSARSSSTPRASKSASTALSFRARLLIWQVTHQAAVKSTNTMRPCACAWATRSGLQGCQRSPTATPVASAVSWRSSGTAHAAPAANTATDVAPKPMRARGPRVAEPRPQAAKASASSKLSSAAAPSMPDCCPSTHTSHTTVANIGKAIAVLKCTIHTPGRGSARATGGHAVAARYGSAMPRPSAAKTDSACPVGKVTASPSEAPMNGAVQGEATATASTPVTAESTMGWRARAASHEPGNTEPSSNTPARFNPISVNKPASTATTTGDCNWKPQPSCSPPARRASSSPASTRNDTTTPAV